MAPPPGSKAEPRCSSMQQAPMLTSLHRQQHPHQQQQEMLRHPQQPSRTGSRAAAAAAIGVSSTSCECLVSSRVLQQQLRHPRTNRCSSSSSTSNKHCSNRGNGPHRYVAAQKLLVEHQQTAQRHVLGSLASPVAAATPQVSTAAVAARTTRTATAASTVPRSTAAPLLIGDYMTSAVWGHQDGGSGRRRVLSAHGGSSSHRVTQEQQQQQIAGGGNLLSRVHAWFTGGDRRQRAAGVPQKTARAAVAAVFPPGAAQSFSTAVLSRTNTSGSTSSNLSTTAAAAAAQQENLTAGLFYPAETATPTLRLSSLPPGFTCQSNVLQQGHSLPTTTEPSRPAPTTGSPSTCAFRSVASAAGAAATVAANTMPSAYYAGDMSRPLPRPAVAAALQQQVLQQQQQLEAVLQQQEREGEQESEHEQQQQQQWERHEQAKLLQQFLQQQEERYVAMRRVSLINGRQQEYAHATTAATAYHPYGAALAAPRYISLVMTNEAAAAGAAPAETATGGAPETCKTAAAAAAELTAAMSTTEEAAAKDIAAKEANDPSSGPAANTGLAEEKGAAEAKAADALRGKRGKLYMNSLKRREDAAAVGHPGAAAGVLASSKYESSNDSGNTGKGRNNRRQMNSNSSSDKGTSSSNSCSSDTKSIVCKETGIKMNADGFEHCEVTEKAATENKAAAGKIGFNERDCVAAACSKKQKQQKPKVGRLKGQQEEKQQQQVRQLRLQKQQQKQQGKEDGNKGHAKHEHHVPVQQQEQGEEAEHQEQQCSSTQQQQHVEAGEKEREDDPSSKRQVEEGSCLADTEQQQQRAGKQQLRQPQQIVKGGRQQREAEEKERQEHQTEEEEKPQQGSQQQQEGEEKEQQQQQIEGKEEQPQQVEEKKSHHQSEREERQQQVLEKEQQHQTEEEKEQQEQQQAEKKEQQQGQERVLQHRAEKRENETIKTAATAEEETAFKTCGALEKREQLQEEEVVTTAATEDEEKGRVTAAAEVDTAEKATAERREAGTQSAHGEAPDGGESIGAPATGAAGREETETTATANAREGTVGSRPVGEEEGRGAAAAGTATGAAAAATSEMVRKAEEEIIAGRGDREGETTASLLSDDRDETIKAEASEGDDCMLLPFGRAYPEGLLKCCKKIHEYDEELQQERARIVQVLLIHDNPDLYLMPYLLTAAHCHHIIDLCARRWRRSRTSKGPADASPDEYHSAESATRTSQSARLRPAETPVVAAVEEIAAAFAGCTVDYLEPLAVVKYEEGQVFKAHHDGAFRPVTLLIYLNDIEEGGETEFPQLHLKLTPTQGWGVMWRNAIPDRKTQENNSSSSSSRMCIDPRVLHAGLAPRKGGPKYVVNCFFNEKPIRQLLAQEVSAAAYQAEGAATGKTQVSQAAAIGKEVVSSQFPAAEGEKAAEAGLPQAVLSPLKQAAIIAAKNVGKRGSAPQARCSSSETTTASTITCTPAISRQLSAAAPRQQQLRGTRLLQQGCAVAHPQQQLDLLPLSASVVHQRQQQHQLLLHEGSNLSQSLISRRKDPPRSAERAHSGHLVERTSPQAVRRRWNAPVLGSPAHGASSHSVASLGNLCLPRGAAARPMSALGLQQPQQHQRRGAHPRHPAASPSPHIFSAFGNKPASSNGLLSSSCRSGSARPTPLTTHIAMNNSGYRLCSRQPGSRTHAFSTSAASAARLVHTEPNTISSLSSKTWKHVTAGGSAANGTNNTLQSVKMKHTADGHLAPGIASSSSNNTVFVRHGLPTEKKTATSAPVSRSNGGPELERMPTYSTAAAAPGSGAAAYHGRCQGGGVANSHGPAGEVSTEAHSAAAGLSRGFGFPSATGSILGVGQGSLNPNHMQGGNSFFSTAPAFMMVFGPMAFLR